MSISCRIHKTSKTLSQTFTKPYNHTLIRNSRQFSTQTFLNQRSISKSRLPELIFTGTLTGILLVCLHLNNTNPIVNEEIKVIDEHDSRQTDKQSTKSNIAYPEGNVFIWGSNR